MGGPGLPKPAGADGGAQFFLIASARHGARLHPGRVIWCGICRIGIWSFWGGWISR